MIIVFTTTPPDEAETFASAIVANKLAACVQVLSEMRSIYIWEGTIQKEAECLLLIKTTFEKYPELEKFIIERHSYDVPEIIAVQAEKVSSTYLRWLGDAIS